MARISQNFRVAQESAHLQNRGQVEPVNQQTIADRLGISRATISRCFTNHRAINPATRARVFELAAQLGYRYLDLRTRSRPKKSSTTTVGVLIAYDGAFTENDRLESPGPELLDGISQLAQLRGVQLDIHYVDSAEMTLDGPSYRRQLGLPRASWRGVLLMYAFPGPVVEALGARFPCVSLLEQYGRLALNCVDVDHYRGIAQLIDLLLAAGHQRIGFFSPVARPESYWTMHRFAAYLEKLLALGLDCLTEDVINIRRAREFRKTGRSRRCTRGLMRE